MTQQGCVYKKKADGTVNTKYVDLLEEDKPISGQKFVCVSFVSPENILKQKNHFFFQEFLKHYEFAKSVQKFTQYLNFLSYKYDFDLSSKRKIFLWLYQVIPNIDIIKDIYEFPGNVKQLVKEHEYYKREYLSLIKKYEELLNIHKQLLSKML